MPTVAREGAPLPASPSPSPSPNSDRDSQTNPNPNSNPSSNPNPDQVRRFLLECGTRLRDAAPETWRGGDPLEAEALRLMEADLP